MIRNNVTSLSVETFFAFIDRELFTPQFPKFQNIDITAGGFKTVVWAMYFAFLLAAVAIYYNRTVIGSLPRALIEHGCLAPENAKTLSELGCAKNPFLKLTLRFGNTLRRSVICTEGEAFESDPKNTARGSKFAEFFLPEKRYKINFATDRFYVPEARRDACVARFRKKGNGLLSVAICAVGGIVCVALIMQIAPALFEIIDNVAGRFAADTGNVLN
ncbi:MAG: hypothetical protein E7640_01100 [Ruminococcaceae bacterium]|nr:hypothetical protein [Oscillospiraceae bacterium]